MIGSEKQVAWATRLCENNGFIPAPYASEVISGRNDRMLYQYYQKYARPQLNLTEKEARYTIEAFIGDVKENDGNDFKRAYAMLLSGMPSKARLKSFIKKDKAARVQFVKAIEIYAKEEEGEDKNA